MKALILAGGFGTRMRPLTLTRPKPLLPIVNRPHLEHVFDVLMRHGVSDVVLTTSYLAEAFEETVERARRRGVRLEVAHEEVARGTAGAIKNAQNLLGDDVFLALNGDVLTDADLGALIELQQRESASAALLLTPVEDPSAYGVVPTDERGRVTGFIEKPLREEAPTNLISAGVYVLDRAVLELIPPDREWSIERSVFPQLAEQGRVFALRSDDYWMDVGTPQKYLRANLDALQGDFRTDNVTVGEGSVVRGPDASIASGADVSSACLGPRVRIEANAKVERSVLFSNVEVGANAIVRDSVLGSGVVVADGAVVEGAVAGDGERLG